MNFALRAGSGAAVGAAPSARADVEDEFGKAIGMTVVRRKVRT